MESAPYQWTFHGILHWNPLVFLALQMNLLSLDYFYVTCWSSGKHWFAELCRSPKCYLISLYNIKKSHLLISLIFLMSLCKYFWLHRPSKGYQGSPRVSRCDLLHHCSIQWSKDPGFFLAFLSSLRPHQVVYIQPVEGDRSWMAHLILKNQFPRSDTHYDC